MVKCRAILLALSALLVPGFLVPSDGSIVGSKHDFSRQGWSGGRICLPCHTPHNANTTLTNAPLWNHAVTTATYTLYSSDTLNAQLEQPSSSSRLCLSCHDGTVAIDSFGGQVGSRMVTGDALIGTDLRGTHPISFEYTSSLANEDGGLWDPTSAPSGLGGTIETDLLIRGKVECSSCHDAHNKDGNEALLRIDNQGSALCLTCHDK